MSLPFQSFSFHSEWQPIRPYQSSVNSCCSAAGPCSCCCSHFSFLLSLEKDCLVAFVLAVPSGWNGFLRMSVWLHFLSQSLLCTAGLFSMRPILMIGCGDFETNLGSWSLDSEKGKYFLYPPCLSFFFVVGRREGEGDWKIYITCCYYCSWCWDYNPGLHSTMDLQPSLKSQHFCLCLSCSIRKKVPWGQNFVSYYE